MKRPALFAFFVTVVCIAFFVLYSFLPRTTPAGRFSSPDEASNSYFSMLYAQTGAVWVFQPTAIPTHGLVHPRSMRIVDVFLVPGGFLGIPILFGMIGKVLGTAVIPFVTPLLAVLAALVWSELIGSRLGRRAGLLAGALLLAQPVWWYVASRTMMPNTAFCAFLIFSAYFFFVAPFKSMLERKGAEGFRLLRGSDAVIAGMLFAMALAIRTSEAYWLALLCGTFVVAYRKKLPWKRLIVFAIASAVTFTPFLFLNNITFGNPFATGYGTVSDVGAQAAAAGPIGSLGPLRPYLFPFGFSSRASLVHAWTYGIAFFWWWSLIVVAALVWLFLRRASLPKDRKREAAASLIAAVLVSLWLVFFYGSWVMFDESSTAAASIGASYFRYWLPIAVLSTVPVALALDLCAKKFFAKRASAVLTAAVALIALTSGLVVFLSQGEGLLAIRDTVRRFDGIAKAVVLATPQSAIIITDHEDKYLFPLYRQVMTPLRSDVTYANLSKLKLIGPLYYFGITLPPTDLSYLRDTKLAPAGLTVETVKTFGDETLYAFKPLPKETKDTAK